MSRTVLIFSGGLDSTTLLYHLLAESGSVVKTLSFDYGQRHGKELTHSKLLSKFLGVDHKQVDLSDVKHLLKGSSQTDDSVQVPQGHYAAENMKLTVVPNRNMIMLSIAMGYALSLGFDQVAIGVHAGDHAIYPDCRPEFIEEMNWLGQICHWTPVRVISPFISLSKGGIVQRGAELKVPFEKTWTCYEGRELHCGKCGSCSERKEAFITAGVKDPTIYES